jgi:hypothetical protein
MPGKHAPGNNRTKEQTAHGGHHAGREQEFRLPFIMSPCALFRFCYFHR